MGSLEARRVAEGRSDELLVSRHRRSIFLVAPAFNAGLGEQEIAQRGAAIALA
jgi:hypothetical protein